jgi:hypothetical protein
MTGNRTGRGRVETESEAGMAIESVEECRCSGGPPGEWEGPLRDCPVHGEQPKCACPKGRDDPLLDCPVHGGPEWGSVDEFVERLGHVRPSDTARLRRIVEERDAAVRADERQKVTEKCVTSYVGVIQDLQDERDQLRTKLEAAERTVENYGDRVKAAEQLRDEVQAGLEKARALLGLKKVPSDVP